MFNNFFLDIAPIDRRRRFIDLITASNSRFSGRSKETLNLYVDVIVTRFYNLFLECNDSENAVKLCIKVEYVVTVRTTNAWNDLGVAYLGQLHPDSKDDAVISYFKILHHGIVKIFKSSRNVDILASINKDVRFCELVDKRLHHDQTSIKFLSIVRYDELNMPRVGSTEIARGSVALYYPRTLDELCGVKLPFDMILKIYNICWNTIKQLHSIKLLIGDFRPSNIFLDLDNNPFIGDFGGYIDMTSSPMPTSWEYSSAYLPAEFHPSGNNSPQYLHDIACLLTTILHVAVGTFCDFATFRDVVRAIISLKAEYADVKGLLTHTVAMECPKLLEEVISESKYV